MTQDPQISFSPHDHNYRWSHINSSFQQQVILQEENLELLITGYKTVPAYKGLLYFSYAATLGLFYLICRWIPRLQIVLSSKTCSFDSADNLIIENNLGQLEILPILSIPFDGVLSTVFPAEADSRKITELRIFDFHHLRFIHHPTLNKFLTAKSWKPAEWNTPADLVKGPSELEVNQRKIFIGSNVLEIDNPGLLKLLVNEALNPFYVFQIFSVILWCFELYFTFATAILIISAIGIATTLSQTRRNINRMREMCRFSCLVSIFRNGQWLTLDSEEIVPGDIIDVLELEVFPCDVVLLEGDCIANESMLTGESVPVHKKAADYAILGGIDRGDTNLSSSISKNTLYAGTKNIRGRPEEGKSRFEPGKLPALVVRTGFDTLKGSLVRSMLFPRPNKFKFYEDSFKFIGVLAMISMVGFVVSIFLLSSLGVTADLIALRALDLITIVVPPSLPASLTIGMNIALSRLRKLGVYCINPPRVNIGGRVNIACFDKTGTLTEEGLDVLGLRASNLKTGAFDELTAKDLNQSETSNNDEHLLHAMATCHSIKLAHEELIGDPLDLKMFEFCKWSLREQLLPGILPDDPSTPVVIVSSPINPDDNKLFVFREFEFVSGLRRMSVIVGRDHHQLELICKGAPEALIPLCQPSSLPRDFDAVLDDYTRSGYRVLAFARKSLNAGDNWRSVRREEMEAELEFTGFIIFENKLKPATAGAISQLKGANIRTVMCTGDNPLTAVSVAKKCGMVNNSTRIYTGVFEVYGENSQKLRWKDMDHDGHYLEEEEGQISIDKKSKKLIKNCAASPIPQSSSHHQPGDYVLAVTGDVFSWLLTNGSASEIKRMLDQGQIFARMSPEEKQLLVESLRNLDLCVCFCGDGANDCGALKAADVGVSLSQAEASVAAPFTSQIMDISCVIDVIRQGRAALVTSFSCFNFMALYSMIQFVTVLLLYTKTVTLSNWQFLYIDFFIILALATTMGRTKAYTKLSSKQPTASLISAGVLVSLIGHVILQTIYQIATVYILRHKPWYSSYKVEGLYRCADNAALFVVSCFLYIFTAIIISKGPPFRLSIYRNASFMFSVLFFLGFSAFLNFAPAVIEKMDIVSLPMSFRWELLLISLSYFFVALFAEKWVFSWLGEKLKPIKKQ